MAEVQGYQHQPRYTDAEVQERREKRKREEEEEERAWTRALTIEELELEGIGGSQSYTSDRSSCSVSDTDHADPDDETDDPEIRLQNSSWCQCNRCEIPANPSVKMCVCCKEQSYDGLIVKLDGPGFCHPCITCHTDFQAICQTNAVLELLAAHTREKRGYPINEEWSNRLYRLLAYQSYTYWIHQHLGRKNRRVIPACVVTKIRNKWPEPHPGLYVSYKDANADEVGDAWHL